MFGQKTNDSADTQNESYASDKKTEISKNDFFSVKKIPVFTMKKDLENINRKSFNQKISSLPEKIITFEETAEKKANFEKSSPFLTAKKTKKKEEIIAPKPEETLEEENFWEKINLFSAKDEKETEKKKEEEIEEKKEEKRKEHYKINALDKKSIWTRKSKEDLKIGLTTEKKEKFNWKKIADTVIIIFIIFITGVSIYYIWIKKINIVPNGIINIQPKKLVLSRTKPNYLIVEDTTNADSFKNAITDYTNKVVETEAGSLIEFTLTDRKNNPIAFENFAQNFGINLSPNILSQLNQNFSLYIYNYGGEKIRLGMSIDAKDELALSLVLEENEKDLVKQLSPLVRNIDFQYPDNNVFDTGEYNGIKIKYQNITFPEEIAIDYAVYDNSFVIGTTKSTIFSILDRKRQEKNQE